MHCDFKLFHSRWPSIEDGLSFMTYSVVFGKMDDSIQPSFWHLSTIHAVILKHITTREFRILFALILDFLSLFCLWVLPLICPSVFSSFSPISLLASLFRNIFGSQQETRCHREKSRLTVALLKHRTSYSARALLWSEEKDSGEGEVRPWVDMGSWGGKKRKGDIANRYWWTGRKKLGIKCKINYVNCRKTNKKMKGTERICRKM